MSFLDDLSRLAKLQVYRFVSARITVPETYRPPSLVEQGSHPGEIFGTIIHPGTGRKFGYRIDVLPSESITFADILRGKTFARPGDIVVNGPPFMFRAFKCMMKGNAFAPACGIQDQVNLAHLESNAMSIELSSTEEAHELLKTYTPEEVRQLWENGAFKGNTKALQDYLFKRITDPDGLEMTGPEM